MNSPRGIHFDFTFSTIFEVNNGKKAVKLHANRVQYCRAGHIFWFSNKCMKLLISFMFGTPVFFLSVRCTFKHISLHCHFPFQENRSFRFVIADVSTGLPMILSSVGSGYVLDLLGFTWCFLILLVCTIFNLLYVIFLIPETIRRKPHVRFFSLQYIKKAITVSQRRMFV